MPIRGKDKKQRVRGNAPYWTPARKGSPDLGQIVIDPSSELFGALRKVCTPGSHWRCLIATVASMEIRRRVSVRLDHETKTGIIGLTFGDRRYERAMTKEEVGFAIQFDTDKRIRKALTVRFDLGDGTWMTRVKATTGGNSGLPYHKIRSKRLGVPREKAIRTRQLDTIKATYKKAP